MPPPNITGKLHLGHALFLTLQDTLTRYHRQCGEDTLWLPGTDHAGLATDAKIQDYFSSINKTPTKEEYLEKAWSWKDDFHLQITNQIKAMGASCDWSREKFTLDENYLKSSTFALNLCKEAGILYQKENQWYLDMSDLAKELLLALNEGEIKIEPESGANTLKHFLNNIEPWCISRQILWGQQIPIFYAKNDSNQYWLAHTIDEATLISGLTCDELIQDSDTLDTWFLSSLWPFATLGWPNNTDDYHKYYPANIIETADDIIFFWCARMLMMGKLCTQQWAFKKIYLHGIIRDANGIKMAKGLGNGIDPLEIIEEYGCDSLRWTLASKCNAGHDSKIAMDDIKSSSQFMNKLWQSGRFILGHCSKMNLSEKDLEDISWKPLDDFEKNYHIYLQNEQFLQASTELQFLFKHEFCDKWIEQNKSFLYDNNIQIAKEGLTIFKRLLLLFHPFIPFITEKLYQEFSDQLLIGQKF